MHRLLRLLVNTCPFRCSMQLYSYRVTAVYKDGEGRILTDVTDLMFSGFIDTTPLFPMNRNIIHSGDVNEKTKRPVLIRRLVPHLLWTARSFNYNVDRLERSVIFTLPRPSKATYDYYLVQFANSNDFEEWYHHFGSLYSDDIPEPSGNIIVYFREYV